MILSLLSFPLPPSALCTIFSKRGLPCPVTSPCVSFSRLPWFTWALRVRPVLEGPWVGEGLGRGGGRPGVDEGPADWVICVVALSGCGTQHVGWSLAQSAAGAMRRSSIRCKCHNMMSKSEGGAAHRPGRHTDCIPWVGVCAASVPQGECFVGGEYKRHIAPWELT